MFRLADGLRRFGVIADTHGLLRPEALEALRGSDLILHAGDVGRPEVLAELGTLAPLLAVRGNVDRGEWERSLPERQSLALGTGRLLLLHRRVDAPADPAAAGYALIVCGHSHQARCESIGGVLYFNPGSAGPRRFRLPVTVGRLVQAETGWRGEIVELSG